MADESIRTTPTHIRRPDVGVDCGPRDPDGLEAATPRLVAEVLPPTTRDIDTFEKIPEYKAHRDIDYILIIEPNAAEVILWSRMPDRSWHRSFTEALHASIELPGLATSSGLAELYEDITFPQCPRLS